MTLIYLIVTLISISFEVYAVLPHQTLLAVGDEVPSINSFWQFKPELFGESEDRPTIVFLHGNSFKQRDKPRTTVTSELSGARLFATFPNDFELDDLPHAVSMQDLLEEERLLKGFRLVAEKYQWGAMVVCPILAVDGPWVPVDVVKFVDNYVRKRNGVNKRLYLVGASVGGFGALRVIDHLASPFSSLPHHDVMFAAVAVAAPGCGPMAGHKFLEDPFCVMPKRLVDDNTMQRIADAFIKLRIPLLIYQGDADKVVPMANSLQLMELVNRGGGWAAMRVVKGGKHGQQTWYTFFAEDFSMYAWLLQHDHPINPIAENDVFGVEKAVWFRKDPISRPRTCGARSDVVFPCIPQNSTERWGVSMVSGGELTDPHPLSRPSHTTRNVTREVVKFKRKGDRPSTRVPAVRGQASLNSLSPVSSLAG